MFKPTIGSRGTFYPAAGTGDAVGAAIVHVWSDTCVNVETDAGETVTSVLIPSHGQAVSGYYFEPQAKTEDTTADGSTEAAIVAAGANVAPRITPADIEANIDGEVYFTAQHGVDGAAQALELHSRHPGGQHVGQLRLLTFCVITLRNGFTVTGESACASPANFNAEIGRRIARENAVAKIWPLMGYELRTKLSS